MRYEMKKLYSGFAAGALLLAGSAVQAATLVTFDASGNGVGGTNTFQAPGVQSDQLFTSLVIGGNSGVQGFTETGKMLITSFSTVAQATSGLGTQYGLWADFTITGLGSWSGSTYTMAPGTVTFTGTLYADNTPSYDNFSPNVTLGTFSLNAGFPQIAFAIAFGSVAPGSSGTALTTLNATLDFLPTAGTTGPGNFFTAPVPFDILFSVGNAGGNNLNTSYSVNGAGVVTFTLPAPGANPGSANITFLQKTPEPGVLSLFGISLLGIGAFVRRRRISA